MTLSEILAQYGHPISEIILAELYQYSDAVVLLFNEARMSLEAQLALEPEIRAQMYRNLNSYGVVQLIRVAHMPLEAQLALEPEIREQLYSNCYAFVHLISEANMPLEAQLALESAIRAQLYLYSYHVVLLLNEARMSLEAQLALEPEIREQLYKKSHAVIRLLNEARQAYQYLITKEIITTQQLVISLLNQNPYLIIQNFVNQNLMAANILPQSDQLNAENITDLVELVKGVAEIRKNARVLSQPVCISSNTSRFFSGIPDDVKVKIAGYTGNDRKDESSIAATNYRKPGS